MALPAWQKQRIDKPLPILKKFNTLMTEPKRA
jgi:hypothetical protein